MRRVRREAGDRCDQAYRSRRGAEDRTTLRRGRGTGGGGRAALPGRATGASRRLVPGGGQRIEPLCDVHAAQARGARSSFGGGSLFDDFFNQFFETAGGSRGVPSGGEAAAAAGAEQVDVTRFFSDSTNELLQRAAGRAMEWGNTDLTAEHLLRASLEDDMVRRVLKSVDADPEAVSAQLEGEADKGARTDASPSLAPDAKRALLAAYEESQALGSSYIGPEHVLLALARDEESDAGRLLSRFGISHTRLRGAVVRGVGQEGEARGQESSTPTVDECSRGRTRGGGGGRGARGPGGSPPRQRWTISAATSPRWRGRASWTRSSGARTR